MRDRLPGQAAIEKLVVESERRGRPTRLQRALGVSPIHSSDLGVHADIAWERLVAAELRTLPSAWRVFHSLPAGIDRSDVDHVVVGPGGLFVVRSTGHPGKRIFVTDRGLFIGSRLTDYIADSQREGSSITSAVRNRLPWSPDFRPLIVLVKSRSIHDRRRVQPVEVQDAREVARWLRKLDPILSADAVDHLIEVVDDPGTWPAAETIDGDDLENRYAALVAAHRRAGRIRLLWALAGVAILVGIAVAVLPHLL